MANELSTQPVEDVSKAYVSEINSFQELLKELKGTPVNLSPLTGNYVAEVDAKAKAFLAAYAQSKEHRAVEKSWEVHKFLKAMENKVTEYPLLIRKACSDWLSQREILRRRKIEAERREREAVAQKQQQEEREREIEHLKTLGKEEEAEQRAADPLPPVSMPESKDERKVEQVSMVEKRIGKVTDKAAFVMWVATNPSWLHLVDPAESELKRALTANPHLQIPGVAVEVVYEKRNRA